jgi:predicted DNA-binding transcriptional regulator YafY
MSKSDSLLSILWLLNARGKMTAQKIAEELEINIRTVYRYIDALCISGAPIISEAGPNGGYSLPRDFIKAPLILDMDEKKALLQSALFAKESGYPYENALDRATHKLKMYCNNNQSERLEDFLRGLHVIGSTPSSEIASIIETLDLSITNNNSIQIEYDKGCSTEENSRCVDPYGVVNWNGKWYLVGFCHKRNDIRVFRADRIKYISQLDSKFTVPENFSARDYVQKSMLPDIMDTKNLIIVKIEGATHAIHDISNHWIFSNLLQEQSDTTVSICGDHHLIFRYMPYYLLSFGKSIRITQPLELKERLAEITLDLLKYYQNNLNNN